MEMDNGQWTITSSFVRIVVVYGRFGLQFVERVGNVVVFRFDVADVVVIVVVVVVVVGGVVDVGTAGERFQFDRRHQFQSGRRQSVLHVSVHVDVDVVVVVVNVVVVVVV